MGKDFEGRWLYMGNGKCVDEEKMENYYGVHHSCWVRIPFKPNTSTLNFLVYQLYGNVVTSMHTSARVRYKYVNLTLSLGSGPYDNNSHKFDTRRHIVQ